MFDEPYRPGFHFTPPRGWINDPNGLVYFRDQWHLFYQYCPQRPAGGMLWGHAVSDDLLHWDHLPPAIVPDAHGSIWSGSAAVDHHDTSGLFGGKPGMVCLFTYFDPADGFQSQGLAYSADGIHFQIHPANPVIPKWKNMPGRPDDRDVRDPKVFWHEPTGRWIMAIAGGKLRIYSSANLLDWRFESINDDIWTECPDLFPLPIDGDPARTQWVLSGGGRWYMLGDFDGRRFTSTTPQIVMDHGPDFYATQTWSDAPDGRRIAISWLFAWNYDSNAHNGIITNALPTTPWSGNCLGVPCELSLRSTPSGNRLIQRPIAEIEGLHQRLAERRDFELRPGVASLGVVAGKALDVRVAFKTEAALTIALPAAKPEYTVTYDAPAGRLTLDRTAASVQAPPTFAKQYSAPLPRSADGTIRLRLLIDHTSLELYADDGAFTLSAMILPDPHAGGLRIDAVGGPCEIVCLEIDAVRAASFAVAEER